MASSTQASNGLATDGAIDDIYWDIFPDDDSLISSLTFDVERDGQRSNEESPQPAHTDRKVEGLPGKAQHKFLRNIRHICFNVYKRLFTIVVLANLVGLTAVLARTLHISLVPASDLSTASTVNIFIAVAIRQDYVANTLYHLAWLVPLSAPLQLRRRVAKVYEHGGIHAGCGVAGTVWSIGLAAAVCRDYASGTMQSISAPILTFTVLALLLLIVVLAWPRIRTQHHNAFEHSHRIGGWLAIGTFWALQIVSMEDLRRRSGVPISTILIREPTFWLLIGGTIHLILPWLRLRRWHFEAENLSANVLRLTFAKRLEFCRGLAIAESPLHEYHPFATYPNADGRSTSILLSRGGDWTKRQIDEPRWHYWVRGVPKVGLLSMAHIFRRVVMVTTGSGIGPCLSFLSDSRRRASCRVLWSAPTPSDTFGEAVVNAVKQADAQAVILDSKKEGRADMVLLAWRLYVESDAEAVFVISNPKLTRKVRYGLESRGVPAYGPIWDS